MSSSSEHSSSMVSEPVFVSAAPVSEACPSFCASVPSVAHFAGKSLDGSYLAAANRQTEPDEAVLDYCGGDVAMDVHIHEMEDADQGRADGVDDAPPAAAAPVVLRPRVCEQRRTGSKHCQGG